MLFPMFSRPRVVSKELGIVRAELVGDFPRFHSRWNSAYLYTYPEVSMYLPTSYMYVQKKQVNLPFRTSNKSTSYFLHLHTFIFA